jgi:hypothetical protein
MFFFLSAFTYLYLASSPDTEYFLDFGESSDDDEVRDKQQRVQQFLLL